TRKVASGNSENGTIALTSKYRAAFTTGTNSAAAHGLNAPIAITQTPAIIITPVSKPATTLSRTPTGATRLKYRAISGNVESWIAPDVITSKTMPRSND